jgi:hypothetical protein
MRLPSGVPLYIPHPSTPCVNTRDSYLQLQGSGFRIYVEVEKVGCSAVVRKDMPERGTDRASILHKKAFAHNYAQTSYITNHPLHKPCGMS